MAIKGQNPGKNTAKAFRNTVLMSPQVSSTVGQWSKTGPQAVGHPSPGLRGLPLLDGLIGLVLQSGCL